MHYYDQYRITETLINSVVSVLRRHTTGLRYTSGLVKVHSTFHSFVFDKISTKRVWELKFGVPSQADNMTGKNALYSI